MSDSSSNSGGYNELFDTAVDDLDLSQQSRAVLQKVDVGVQLQNQIGLRSLGVQANEIFYFMLVIDDSSSIADVWHRDPVTGNRISNAELLMEGANGMLDAFGKAKRRDTMLVYTAFLNEILRGKPPLNHWVTLENAERLTPQNYHPSGLTPLYRSSVIALGSALAETLQAKQQGQIARCGILIVSDGADTYGQATPDDVRTVVEDMLQGESLIWFMGIDDGFTDFRAIGKSMGVPEKCILLPKSDPKEMRAAFDMASQSMVQASQGATGFSAARQATTQGGGFTA